MLPVAADRVLFRRYLDAGGKIIWLGIPPAMWPADDKGQRSYSGIHWQASEQLLGGNYDAAQFDRFGATVTPAGEAWGLHGWWLSSWAVRSQAGLEELATDEHGLAAAWVRSYGGPPGTGFVQLVRPDWGDAALLELAAIAEYRPKGN